MRVTIIHFMRARHLMCNYTRSARACVCMNASVYEHVLTRFALALTGARYPPDELAWLPVVGLKSETACAAYVCVCVFV